MPARRDTGTQRHIGRPGAVVLLSGGIDSATALAICREQGYRPFALTVHYGQRHDVEVRAARAIASHLGVAAHKILTIDLRETGRSALTGARPVPKGRTLEEIGSEIPLTYVPARNTVLLSFALGWAEVLGVGDIFFGANVVDYSGYPDCRPEYLRAFESMANLALKACVEGKLKIRIHAPLISLKKSEILRRGLRLGVDFAKTHSCYDPTLKGLACGQCDSCVLRLGAFREIGRRDPVRYVERGASARFASVRTV